MNLKSRFFFNREIVRPINRIIEANRAAARGEDQFTVIPEVEIPGNEIGEVMRSRNEMLRSLKQAEEQIRTFNEHLEQLVIERTEALRKSEEQLRASQRLETAGKLVGGVAHDFNNFLTAILAYSELLRGHLDEGNPSRAYADEIYRAGERAARLTRQLLAFSRKQILKPVLFDLNGLTADLGKMLQQLIGGNIELATSLGRAPALVEADQGQMEQVIMNLAINARDAMPNGGKLTIETAHVGLDEDTARAECLVPTATYVKLTVSDTGCGMEASVRSRIFEPLFTTKEPGKGTGLGLSTVYGIVKQSGGCISVSSEVGVGTTFEIYLPAAKENSNRGSL